MRFGTFSCDWKYSNRTVDSSRKSVFVSNKVEIDMVSSIEGNSTDKCITLSFIYQKRGLSICRFFTIMDILSYPGACLILIFNSVWSYLMKAGGTENVHMRNVVCRVRCDNIRCSVLYQLKISSIRLSPRIYFCYVRNRHYNDVIMSAMANQITGVSIVYSTACSGADQRKHQSSASLAFAALSSMSMTYMYFIPWRW